MPERSTESRSGPTSGSSDSSGHRSQIISLPLGERHRRIVFHEMVKAEIEDGILRYSKRRQLLRYARRIGIPEFEATLMIADVQHTAGQLEKPHFLSEEEILAKLEEANRANAMMRNIVIASTAAIVANIWLFHWLLEF